MPELPQDKPSDIAWLNKVLFSEEAAESNPATSFFAWSQFDVVILQDLWVVYDDKTRSSSRLEFAGRVLAAWDNDRGNFRTKKVVLVTDTELFDRRVLGPPSVEGVRPNSEAANQTFDPKGSLELVPFYNQKDRASDALRSAIEAAQSNSSFASSQQNNDQLSEEVINRLKRSIRDYVTGPVIYAAAPAIRENILESTKLIFVEDEEEPLKKTYKSLTGKDLPALTKQNLEATDDRTSVVHIVSVAGESQHTANADKDAIGPRVVRAPDLRVTRVTAADDKLFSTVLKIVGDIVDNSEKDRVNDNGKKKPQKDLVVITDILFHNSGRSGTGVDLIRELRSTFSNRIHIIAFTGFGNPFVAMSAYHQGSDFLVVKGRFDGRHDSLQVEGTHLLLQTLALLCFQRSYLYWIRKQVGMATLGKDANSRGGLPDLIRKFEQILPQHTLSFHIQQEWQDTLYLLKLAQTPGISDARKVSKEVMKEVKELIGKYER